MKHKHVLSAILCGAVFLLPSVITKNVFAATSLFDDRFEFYLLDLQFADICVGFIPPPPEANNPHFADACLEVLGASFSSSTNPALFPSISNFGTTGAISRSSNNSAVSTKSAIKDRIEELQEEESGGASADGSGGWGVLIAPQIGKTERSETNIENGYESDLSGLTLGVDYRFSDQFVMGIALGMLEDDASFDNNNGELLTESDTVTFYATWSPSDDKYLDGYLGLTSMSFNSVRFAAFGSTNPTDRVSSVMDGEQLLLGISGGMDWYFSSLSVGTFLNLDYVKTTIDEYDESGGPLRLKYFEQETDSLTAAVGVRVDQYSRVSWATLVPNARILFVHEFKDDSRQIETTLLALPISNFIIETDAPDRNYILLGLGVTAAMDGNKQLYLDYEQQAAHEFLDTWTVSAGFLMEF